MPRYRVTIFGRDYDAMADLVRKHKVDVLQQTVRRVRASWMVLLWVLTLSPPTPPAAWACSIPHRPRESVDDEGSLCFIGH
jgi:hypothetical protein